MGTRQVLPLMIISTTLCSEGTVLLCDIANGVLGHRISINGAGVAGKVPVCIQILHSAAEVKFAIGDAVAVSGRI